MQEDADLIPSKVMSNLLPVRISGNLDRKDSKSKEVAAAVPVVEKHLRKEDAVASTTDECKGSGHHPLDSHRELGFALAEPEEDRRHYYHLPSHRVELLLWERGLSWHRQRNTHLSRSQTDPASL